MGYSSRGPRRTGEVLWKRRDDLRHADFSRAGVVQVPATILVRRGSVALVLRRPCHGLAAIQECRGYREGTGRSRAIPESRRDKGPHVSIPRSSRMGPYSTEIRASLFRTMTGNRESFDPLAFWEERLQHFDLSAVGYAGLGLRYNRWLYRVRSFVFRRTLRRAGLNVDSAQVLDVGS